MTEQKGIDFSELTQSPEQATTPEIAEEQNDMTMETLIEELKKADPVLAMMAAQVFDMGTTLADLVQKFDLVEDYVGYLLSKDPEMQAKMKAQEDTARVQATENTAETTADDEPRPSDAP